MLYNLLASEYTPISTFDDISFKPSFVLCDKKVKETSFVGKTITNTLLNKNLSMIVMMAFIFIFCAMITYLLDIIKQIIELISYLLINKNIDTKLKTIKNKVQQPVSDIYNNIFPDLQHYFQEFYDAQNEETKVNNSYGVQKVIEVMEKLQQQKTISDQDKLILISPFLNLFFLEESYKRHKTVFNSTFFINLGNFKKIKTSLFDDHIGIIYKLYPNMIDHSNSTERIINVLEDNNSFFKDLVLEDQQNQFNNKSKDLSNFFHEYLKKEFDNLTEYSYDNLKTTIIRHNSHVQNAETVVNNIQESNFTSLADVKNKINDFKEKNAQNLSDLPKQKQTKHFINYIQSLPIRDINQNLPGNVFFNNQQISSNKQHNMGENVDFMQSFDNVLNYDTETSLDNVFFSMINGRLGEHIPFLTTRLHSLYKSLTLTTNLQLQKDVDNIINNVDNDIKDCFLAYLIANVYSSESLWLSPLTKTSIIYHYQLQLNKMQYEPIKNLSEHFFYNIIEFIKIMLPKIFLIVNALLILSVALAVCKRWTYMCTVQHRSHKILDVINNLDVNYYKNNQLTWVSNSIEKILSLERSVQEMYVFFFVVYITPIFMLTCIGISNNHHMVKLFKLQYRTLKHIYKNLFLLTILFLIFYHKKKVLLCAPKSLQPTVSMVSNILMTVEKIVMLIISWIWYILKPIRYIMLLSECDNSYNNVITTNVVEGDKLLWIGILSLWFYVIWSTVNITNRIDCKHILKNPKGDDQIIYMYYNSSDNTSIQQENTDKKVTKVYISNTLLWFFDNKIYQILTHVITNCIHFVILLKVYNKFLLDQMLSDQVGNNDRSIVLSAIMEYIENKDTYYKELKLFHELQVKNKEDNQFDISHMKLRGIQLNIPKFSFNVKKNTQKKQVTVLKNLFTTIKDSKIILQGKSGSGKSTFFNIITGVYRDYLQPGQVKYILEDKNGNTTCLDVKNIKQSSILNKIFYFPQTTHLPPTLTIKEALLWFEPNATWEQVIYSLERSRIFPEVKLNRTFASLSGGQQKRVLLACIILKLLRNKFDLILLDEYYVGLDKENRAMLTETLFNIESILNNKHGKIKHQHLYNLHQLHQLQLSKRLNFIIQNYKVYQKEPFYKNNLFAISHLKNQEIDPYIDYKIVIENNTINRVDVDYFYETLFEKYMKTRKNERLPFPLKSIDHKGNTYVSLW